MKTKLILLFLFIASFAKAQISIQESFEGGVTPTNWTNNGFAYFNNSGFATTGNYSTFASIAIGSDRTLSTNSQISTGLAINISVQARKNAGPAGALGLYYLLAGSSTLNPIQIEYFGTQFIAYHLISGTIPAGTIPSGTSVKFVIRALGSAGTSGQAFFDDFLAAEVSPATVPTISAIATTPFQNSVNFNYALNANNGATTSIIRYGTSSGGLVSQITGFSATGNTVTSNVITLSGLLSNTQYFFRIDATNSAGTTTSTEQSFTTTSSTPQVSTQYNFNNTYKNTLGSNAFNVGTFVSDRNSTPSSAISTAASSATISDNLLPKGASNRTVSLWYKTATNSGYPSIFAYGSNVTSQTFGLYLGPNGNPIFQGYANDATFPGTFSAGVWQHVVITYNGSLVKMYMNGSLIGSQSYTLNTTTIFNDFRFGNGTSTVTYDDLKIFNYVLTDADALSLYTNNTLSSADFNQNNLQVSLYPNPATDMLNIEMANEINSIEIYNIQGQKVRTANQKQINISELASGLYMIRIQSNDNAIATKKFVKK
jgi:hypothetical protein